MRVIPAIDLKDGLCVRLLQGRKEDATVYSRDPVQTARLWESYGARHIHIVDLDGAFTGHQKNLHTVVKIREAVSADLQVGGGIRDLARIDALLSLGVNRVILGSSAVSNPEIVREASRRHGGRVWVGVDARDGFVAVKGWVELTQVTATDFAMKMAEYGAGGIIYTDISRDGMLTGPNIDATGTLVRSLRIPVIASGGVSSLDDIRKLSLITGLWGAITGKALYAGTLDLRDALRVAGEEGT
jgi:phosphoribosylformimino-5-aminoimidazole carboxamide ribotide isomerase